MIISYLSQRERERDWSILSYTQPIINKRRKRSSVFKRGDHSFVSSCEKTCQLKPWPLLVRLREKEGRHHPQQRDQDSPPLPIARLPSDILTATVPGLRRVWRNTAHTVSIATASVMATRVMVLSTVVTRTRPQPWKGLRTSGVIRKSLEWSLTSLIWLVSIYERTDSSKSVCTCTCTCMWLTTPTTLFNVNFGLWTILLASIILSFPLFS